MNSYNPLLDDDDEEEFSEPGNQSTYGALPSTSELQLPDFSFPEIASKLSPLPPELPANPEPSEASFPALTPSLEVAHPEEESDSLADLEDELSSDFDDDPLASLLDSLDETEDFKAPSYEEATPAARFTSMLEFDDDFSSDSDEAYEDVSIDLDKVITVAIEAGASDIHIRPYDEIAFTVLGEIVRASEFGEIDPNMTVKLQQKIVSHQLEQAFTQEFELDTSYVVKTGLHKGRRLRLSVGRTDGAVYMVFRIIADRMPTPDELNIPQPMRDWVNLPSGLVLVNGPTGSGKSTTLSSLMQEMQFTRACNIITVEKPIEYMYGTKPGQKAIITQREVGRDTRSFAAALTSAMRQAPNVILVGEVRNKLEIDELIRAAETGHLAISTMHTTSCPATVNRIRSLYEGDDQLRVLSSLSENLRGLMTQALVVSPDGTRRTAVREVLQVNTEISDYILKGDTKAMRQYQERNGITMEHELVKAVLNKEASIASARGKAPDPFYFDELLKNSR